MSQPFSGIPDPGIPSRIRRRFQPGPLQEALRASLLKARRYGQDLWHRGKRNPRTLALVGGAVAFTLVGAYALSASGSDSLCPPTKAQKGRKGQAFVLLMDKVPNSASGSEIEINYDVCGLASGTAYRGRVQLSQPQPVQKKKKSKKKRPAQPKPVVVTFKGEVDGVASRHSQPLSLVSAKPGAYTLELSVVDNQGRERKKLQKVVVTSK